MSDPERSELEARVVQLERQLEQVLALLSGGKGDSEIQEDQPAKEAKGAGAPIRPRVFPETLNGGERVGGEEEKRRGGREGLGGGAKAADGSGGRAKTADGSDFLRDLGALTSGGTFLSRLGIGLLLLSVVFFFKYSIDQGWLTEWVRLAMGIIAGIILVLLGFRGASKGEPLGTVLAGGGIATFFITGFVGHQWFGLFSYPAAFGLLVAASALGIFFALRGGLQGLAIVGLIGALATPLLLTAPRPEVAGLALYVTLIVGAVATIYMVRGWRALFLLAVVIGWFVFSTAVGPIAGSREASSWVVQGAIAFCALVFWLVPLLRVELRAGNPPRWPRPEDDEPTWNADVPWNAHLDALSLLMPLVGIAFSSWLWDLSRSQLGWVFFGTALLAQGVGWRISQSEDPEGSAGTQWFVAVLLATGGLGLLLTGDVLYLALIAEAVALLAVGSRKGSTPLLGLGGVVELTVAGVFLFRLAFGGTLLEGDLSSVFAFAAVGGAAFIGTRFRTPGTRKIFFVGAYLGLMALIGRELGGHATSLYLAFVLTAIITQAIAHARKNALLSALGHVPAVVVLSIFWSRLAVTHNLWSGDLTSLVDLFAIGGVAYVGTLFRGRQESHFYLFGAYIGLLIWTGRELYPMEQGQAIMSLAFGVEGTVLLVAGLLTARSLLHMTGMATLLLVVVKVLLIDLAAVEPIWRVLLLFLFAVLFLVLSKVVQGRKWFRIDKDEADSGEGVDSA